MDGMDGMGWGAFPAQPRREHNAYLSARMQQHPLKRTASLQSFLSQPVKDAVPCRSIHAAQQEAVRHFCRNKYEDALNHTVIYTAWDQH